MSDYRVATRYALSVFQLAEELNLIEQVYSDMLVVDKVCSENRNLILLLKNPIIRYDYKLRVLQRIFKGKIEKLVMQFFGLICRKNRASILPHASKSYIELYDEYKGILRATITTAVPLSEDLKKEFVRKLEEITGKQIILVEKVDESIIGGFILKSGDQQINDSIVNKLNELRRKLIRR